MTDARYRCLIVVLALLPAALMAGWLSCSMVPTSPGYISMPRGAPPSVDIALSGGGGVELNDRLESVAGGGGELQVEPYASRSLSFPITLAGGGSEWGGGGAGRAGVRGRLLSWMALGAGLGGGVYKGDEYEFDGNTYNEEPVGACFLDAELAVAHRWRVFGFSLATRPTFELVHELFYLPTELVLAFYPVQWVALTIHAYGGPVMSLDPDETARSGWIVGGVGIVFHLPPSQR